MKRYLINIVLFFAAVVVCDVGVGFLGDYLQANAKGGATNKINNLVTKDVHDVLIFGSSRARHHYDTPFMSDSLRIDVYNAGYDGNGVILSYGLLKMILERYRPELIICDVEPVFDIYKYAPDNNNKRYLGLLKPYFRDKNIELILRDVSLEDWYKVHSGMMRYNTSILSMILDNFKNNNSLNNG